MFSRRFLFSILIVDNTHSPYQLPLPLLRFFRLSSSLCLHAKRFWMDAFHVWIDCCVDCLQYGCVFDWLVQFIIEERRNQNELLSFWYDCIMVHGFEWFDWCRVFLCIILSLAFFVFVFGMQQFFLLHSMQFKIMR